MVLLVLVIKETIFVDTVESNGHEPYLFISFIFLITDNPDVDRMLVGFVHICYFWVICELYDENSS